MSNILMESTDWKYLSNLMASKRVVAYVTEPVISMLFNNITHTTTTNYSYAQLL
jgi:hypothetical protein